LLGCKTGDAACLSPRLLSAALVSARFPFVTPAARISLGPGADRRFVDGGYFENSGVETAQDLLLQIGRRDGVTFHLIAMDFPVKAGAERDRPHWLGEIMSPVRAFLNARGARGELAKRQAENWARREQDGIRYHSATLDDRAAQFTLGWTLSARTFDQIEFEIWNDSSAGRLDKKCLEKEQVQNRELLAGMAGLPMPETGLSVCPQGR